MAFIQCVEMLDQPPLTLRIIYINNNTNRKSNCSEELSDVVMEEMRQDLTFKIKTVSPHIYENVSAVSLSIINSLCLGLFLFLMESTDAKNTQALLFCFRPNK